MSRTHLACLALLASCATAPKAPPTAERKPASPTAEAADPYLWLEDIQGEKALDWVRARNQRTRDALEQQPDFAPLAKRLQAALDDPERIPGLTKVGDRYYNLWRDEKNVRGLWRRIRLEDYRKAKPAWETVLDIDALAAAEKENWFFNGFTCLYPRYVKCLVQLSRGGSDATVTREFDLQKKAFVAGGFQLSEAKSGVSWKDDNTLFVATDFGPGTLTRSGYPRVVKEWKRNTPLESAQVLFEASEQDMAASGDRVFTGGKVYDLFLRRTSFFAAQSFLLEKGKLERLAHPDDAELTPWGKYAVLLLRSDWKVGETVHPKGSLLIAELDSLRPGPKGEARTPRVERLFEPSPSRALAKWSAGKSTLVLTEQEDVRDRLVWVRAVAGKGPGAPLAFERIPLPVAVGGTLRIEAVDENAGDDYWLYADDFVAPPSYHLLSLPRGKTELLKRNKAHFDASNLEVQQHFATSKDGTKVPYFQVSKKGLALEGKHPTLLYGYGGFEISLKPAYSVGAGAGWLERGGVYVVANIRGGGEYGPTWHQAALRHHRQRAYDDFAAVAEDLIRRKVTSPPHLGIMGGSNGGLLTTVLLTQRPELFGAVVSQVPLADMKRYHRMLAGHSWVEEYGDPDKPEDWAVLQRFSPYQNVKRGTYPPVLLTTSTRDDRVHPGHARKMVARLEELGHQVSYYENIEGGHAGAANNAQRAHLSTLAYVFLWKQLSAPAAD